jgi:hypothetical protein
MPKSRSSRRTNQTVAALPKFNAALGEFLALPEHLDQRYSDVVTQIYPLKASISRLQEFCDGYLNLSEDPPVYFKAAVPWVLMQVCDYGEMASTSRNVGWFSQHELAFGVPVRWYKKRGNNWVFVDWAMVFPFIFVDNPLSMSGGRKIYGWSKSGIRIDATAPIFEPGNARRLVSISLVTSGTNYGDLSDTEEFLQIFQRRPYLSARSAISDMFTAIPRAIANSLTAAYSIYETTGPFPLNYADRDFQSLQEMIMRFYGQLNVLTPDSIRTPPEKAPSQQASDRSLQFNIITLKQVRDVSSLSGACFQAIVGSKMGIERTIDGGYLFDPLSGDISGGIHINLLDSKDQPIVKTLGIESSEYSSVGGKPASTIRPLMPFWLKMDLRYGLADYQCWRTDTTEWTTDDKLKHIARREIPYLNMGSGASQEVGGPYRFPSITFRVMPLKAERDQLQKLVGNYLKNDFFEFEVASRIKDKVNHSVVCLVGTNFEEMSAATDPDTGYSDRELTFAVPVLWWEKRTPRIKHPALIPLYTFTGTDWNAATSYEVYGQLALKSRLLDADSAWLTDPVEPITTPLVTVKTELFPETGKSQEAQEVPVLEVSSAQGPTSHPPIADYLDQLGLNHFWSGERFHSIALKQVVDAQDPVRANYQALVGLGRKFTGTKGGSPKTGALAPLSISVYDYPTFPIVETLGLISQQCDKSGRYRVYTLKPIDPFWISGAMVSDAGHEMCWRVGTAWERNPIFDATISDVQGAVTRKPVVRKRRAK